MNRLDNFSSVSLNVGDMDRILGGMNNPNPKVGAKEEVAKFAIGYVASKAVDATVDAAKSVDWKKVSEEMQKNAEANYWSMYEATKYKPQYW